MSDQVNYRLARLELEVQDAHAALDQLDIPRMCTDCAPDGVPLSLGGRIRELAQADVMRLQSAIRDEHFRSDGTNVTMEMPQHERSIMRCDHPLCKQLDYVR